MTSTDASVGPYRLCSSAPPSTSKKRSCNGCGSASPEHTTQRSPSQAAAEGCRRNTSSIDGTKCATLTRASLISCARYAGSRCPPGLATTSVAPVTSGQKNSQTDTSKPYGVFCSTRSPGSSGSRRCIQASRFTTPACGTTTPFGRPVDPEVKIT
ncbi:hypothetical protein GCM10020001_000120 [Nonomuraea salmonea]